MKRLILDAGHGGSDNGATSHGINEDDIALNVVFHLEKILNRIAPDVELVFTRQEDKKHLLKDRLEAIMTIKPDAFVSIHCNSIPDNPETFYDERKYAEGFEVFYRDNGDLPLAEKISRVMGRSDLWRRNRGIKQDQEWLGKRLTVLNSLKIPSVLVEIGFLSNDHDRKMIVENVGGIAELIAHGIIDYINALETTDNA